MESKRTLIAGCCLLACALACSACTAAPVQSAALEPATQPVYSYSSEPLPAAAPETALPSPAPDASALPAASPENADAIIQLYLNGNRLLLDTPCVMQSGVVMAPAAEVLTSFSRSITCRTDGDTLYVEDTDRSHTITLTNGQADAVMDGKALPMDAPAALAENGEMRMPISAFMLLFDADNKFVEEYNSVYIVESGLC